LPIPPFEIENHAVIALGGLPNKVKAVEMRVDVWQSISFFLQARRVVVPNLAPGVTYTFKFRALGGSTGSGDWSDSVSHMAA